MTKIVLDTHDVPVNLSVTIDEATIRKELEKRVNSIIQDKINNFFGVSSEWSINQGRKLVKGEGLVAIEDKLINEWVSDSFQAKLQKYFDDNFERVMDEAMRVALQHKANKFVHTREQIAKQQLKKD